MTDGVGHRGVHSDPFEQVVDHQVLHFLVTPARQPGRQVHQAEAHPDQAGDLQAQGFEQAPHLAVAAFLENDVVPVVGPLPAAVLDALDQRRPVLELDAALECGRLLRGDAAEDAHGVLALDLVARVHEVVGEFAGSSEQQQAAGVEIQPPDGHPAGVAQEGQALEHVRPALGVVAADDLALGLVVDQHPRRARRVHAQAHALAVHLDAVVGADTRPQGRGLAVDPHPAGEDQRLHVAARADAGLGEQFVELVGDFRLGRRGRRLAGGIFGLHEAPA